MSQGNDMKGSTLREGSDEGAELAVDDVGDEEAVAAADEDDEVPVAAAGDMGDEEAVVAGGDVDEDGVAEVGEEPMNLCAGNAGNLRSPGKAPA